VRACSVEQALPGLRCPFDRAWLNYGEFAHSLNFCSQLTPVMLTEMMFEILLLTVGTPR